MHLAFATFCYVYVYQAYQLIELSYWNVNVEKDLEKEPRCSIFLRLLCIRILHEPQNLKSVY